MTYGEVGWFRGDYPAVTSSPREKIIKTTKPRRRTMKPPPPLAINSKDLQRPGVSSSSSDRGSHRRSQRQRNKVNPLNREPVTSTVAAAQCLFCIPGTRVAVSAFPASSRKGSQVVERNRSSASKTALHPQNLPQFTPNEVVLNWKAYSQSSSIPSSPHRPRAEVTQTSSFPRHRHSSLTTQNSTTFTVPKTTNSYSYTSNTATTTLHGVSFARSFNGSYLATLLPGPFLDRSLLFPSAPATEPDSPAGIAPEEQLVAAASADQGLSSGVVIGLAVGCVLAFWLVIGPIVCLVMRRSMRTSQTKLFQRQDCRAGSGKRGALQGSTRLLEQMEICALEKARLYHRTEYPDDGHGGGGRFPVVYAPVPQAPPSPTRDFCTSGYDPTYISTTSGVNDSALERNSSDASTRTYETLSVDGTSVGFCVCGRERFCLGGNGSARTPPVVGCPAVVQNGRWQHPLTKKNTDFDGWYPAEGCYSRHQLPPDRTKADSDDVPLNFPTIGSAGTTRKFPKMGQTCLRNSYAFRGRTRAHGPTAQDGAPDWSAEDGSRPRPEGRARSEDRMDDEVLINRCVRTPVGYRRLARAGSVSPRVAKARRQASAADPTCLV